MFQALEIFKAMLDVAVVQSSKLKFLEKREVGLHSVDLVLIYGPRHGNFAEKFMAAKKEKVWRKMMAFEEPTEVIDFEEPTEAIDFEEPTEAKPTGPNEDTGT